MYEIYIKGYLVYLPDNFPDEILGVVTSYFDTHEKEYKENYLSVCRVDDQGRKVIGIGAYRLISKFFPKLEMKVTAFEVKDTHKLNRPIINDPIVLRPYQEEAKNAMMLRKGGVIRLPTGSGKTEIALSYAITQLNNGHVLILEPTQIAQQTVIERCELYKLPVIEYKASRSVELDTPFIIVAIPTSLVNDYKSTSNLINRENIRTLIADECHHLSCETWMKCFEGLPYLQKSFGFSATILGELYNFRDADFQQILMCSMTGELIYSRSAKEPEIAQFLDIPLIFTVPFVWNEAPDTNNYTVISKEIEENTARHKFIANIINHLVKLGFLGLSITHRKSTSENILKWIDHPSVKWFGGGDIQFYNAEGQPNSTYIRENLGNTIKSIIATNHLNESANLPNLDFVVLSENVNSRLTIQRSGRVVRRGGKKSLVINVLDLGFGVLESQSKKRVKSLIDEYGIKTIRLNKIEEINNYLKVILGD